MKAASGCPAIVRWPGVVPAGQVSNGIAAAMDLFVDAGDRGRRDAAART